MSVEAASCDALTPSSEEAHSRGFWPQFLTRASPQGCLSVLRKRQLVSPRLSDQSKSPQDRRSCSLFIT